MKTGSLLLGLGLLSIVEGQQQKAPNGTIYGIVTTLDGQPAKGLGIAAMPVNVGMGAWHAVEEN
jgi:hypothetical protein